MKRVLVIVPTYYPSADANTICAQRILKNEKDIEFTVLTEQYDDNLAVEEIYEDVRIIRYKIRSLRKDLKNKENSIFLQLGSYVKSKILSYYYNYDINFDRICNFFLEGQKYIFEQQFDIIISFANPIEGHYLASKISQKYNIPWIASYFDPFFSNKTKTESGYIKRKRLEEKILKHATHIVMPTFIEQDYKRHSFRFYNDIIKCELPGIRRIKQNKDFQERLIETDAIKCVFVGNLYWKIRNPKALINLFMDIGANINLYFVGGCFDGDIVKLLENDGFNIPQNVKFLGRVSPTIAERYLCEADILVNIGNTTDNQLPGKIFDYISMGKPVLNVRKILNDPSNVFFAQYPLSLTIDEGTIEIEKTKKEIKEFCIESKGKNLSYEKIEELMQEASVKYVRKKYRELISLYDRG